MGSSSQLPRFNSPECLVLNTYGGRGRGIEITGPTPERERGQIVDDEPYQVNKKHIQLQLLT